MSFEEIFVGHMKNESFDDLILKNWFGWYALPLNDTNALTLLQYPGNWAISQGHDQNLIISNQHTNAHTSKDQYIFSWEQGDRSLSFH